MCGRLPVPEATLELPNRTRTWVSVQHDLFDAARVVHGSSLRRLNISTFGSRSEVEHTIATAKTIGKSRSFSDNSALQARMHETRIEVLRTTGATVARP